MGYLQVTFTGHMNVLIVCEYSGVVRDAFRALGHNAVSCDLRPTESPGPHIQADALEVLAGGGLWDLLIAHPPCTFLSYAGTNSWNKPGRAEKRQEALDFFLALYNAKIPRVAVENPVGWANVAFRKPDQIVHPMHFGDRAYKRTCLWLRNLPPLIHVREDDLFGPRTWTDKPEPVKVDNTPRAKARHFTDGGNRSAKKRAKTFPGMARAMAEQWGSLRPLNL